MPVDAAESSRPKPDTARDVAERILRWSTVIVAAITEPTKYFLRPRDFPSDVEPAKSGGEQAGIVSNAVERAIADPTTEKSFTVAIAADTKVEAVSPAALDQEEVQRRRNLVRTLFNDFWSGVHEKPAAFTERLDQAEDYLNERLAANGEIWRLDAKTRAVLGLPPGSNSPDNGKTTLLTAEDSVPKHVRN
jgi:hypothetical protein